MNWPDLWLRFVSTATPVLPDAGLLRLALPFAWALVLFVVVDALGSRWPKPVRTGVAWVVGLWALVPGPWSPTYWLGLAFQMPSLTSLLICAVWLAVGRQATSPLTPAQGRGFIRLALVGMILGWVLMLDTLAVWPVAVYALGFGTAALAVAAVLVVLAVLPWCSASLIGSTAVLALFVVTRLPTGNLFDALIDPWLWVALHVYVLRRLMIARRQPT